MNEVESIKLRIIEAGRDAVNELIKVARESIIKYGEDDELAADKLKNAAATKKLAIMDAFEILNRIEIEREALEESKLKGNGESKGKGGFAEGKARGKGRA